MRQLVLLLLCGALLLLQTGCSKAADPQQQAVKFTQGWFNQAVTGARDDTLCHALGLLKHPQFTCTELLEHAAALDPETRSLSSFRTRDCIGSVCGDFVELEFSSRDQAGNPSEEIVVLKQDNGAYRMYWYRNTSLLAMLAQPEQSPLDGKSPEQAAYDEITARYPSLYQWPPCYNVRVSSSNLVGQLSPADALDEQLIATQAAACGKQFCFAFVGRKVASICY